MFTLLPRPILVTLLLLGLSGCYPHSLATPQTRVALPIAAQYRVLWDRLPESSRENLLGTIFHLTQQGDGTYELQYTHLRKRERKIIETLKIGDSLYIQLRDGDAFELMRLVFFEDELELYSEIAGCSLKNGDDKDSELNMIRMDVKGCVPALGISPSEMKVVDGVGGILLKDAAAGVEFLARYGTKMYASKKYRLQVAAKKGS